VLTTVANARNFSALHEAVPDGDQKKAQQAALTALGVLVPGEVVSAATAISGALSVKIGGDQGTAAWAHLGLARVLMLVLGLVAVPLLFRYGAGSWWKNGWRGAALVALTMISFAGWLVLQPLSIYQGWFSVDAGESVAIGAVGALVIGALASLLGWSQAKS